MAVTVPYQTLDVFTSSRFGGNQLAIVIFQTSDPSTSTINDETMQLVAREFGFSETVFAFIPAMPTNASAEYDKIIKIPIRIFAMEGEVPFGGHPTVGIGSYLLSSSSDFHVPFGMQLVLATKAGDVPVSPGRKLNTVQVYVPINFSVHPSYAHPKVKTLQQNLVAEDFYNGLEGKEAVVSPVKGMTFILLQVTSLDALARLRPYPEKIKLPNGYLGEWDGFLGIYAFYVLEDSPGEQIRARMFYDMGLEDAASGSAACALAGWLAKETKGMRQVFQVSQGTELGRKSEFGVGAVLDEGTDNVSKIWLEGMTVEVMSGNLML